MSKLRTLAYAGLFVACILTAIDVMSFDLSFFEEFYSKNQIADTIGITDEELIAATENLLNYTQGKEEELDAKVWLDGTSMYMYNQREIDHMVDVKELYLGAMFVRNSLLVFFLLICVIDGIKHRFSSLIKHKESMFRALAGLLIFIGGISLAALIDFNSFWNTFHHIFFRNDLWLLNPNTDRLILMVPLDFFIQLVTRIVIMSLVYISCIVSVVWILARKGGTRYDSRRPV